MRYLFILCTLILTTIPILTQTDDRVVTISPAGESYIDPEILPGGSLMTYQSGDGIYLAELDPQTGLIATPPVHVDSGATRPLTTFNGPEFGIDADGWALYYAKPNQGTVQIWRAQPPTPLSAGPRHQTQLVSRNPSAPTTRIAAIQGTWENGTAVWFDESDPQTIHEIAAIENGIASLRWIDNSDMLTYSQRTGPDRGQVVLLDTQTNTARTFTNDAGDKTDPYGWFTPDGELRVLAILDNAAVAIYNALGERIATLDPPDESRFDFVSSAEPFVFNGQSYMSLVVKDATDSRERFSDSEVWLFGLDDGYTERCDSGEDGVARSDPEVFIGSENVFVYYNVISGPGATPYEARRCRSNLTVSEPPADTSVCQWIDPQATDSRIDQALAPHYVCHNPSPKAADQLMVFFPGTGAVPGDYQLFVEEAAHLGLHAVGLSYPNARSVNLQICSGDPSCHAAARHEVITGQDNHPDMNVTEANAIENRLVQLLRYMDASQPDAGWDAYLATDQPRWDRIIVAGHSQGAGMAAYVAHKQTVARAILFAWVDVVRGVAVPWILEDHATPPERIFYFDHADDRERGEAAKIEMFRAFGLQGEANVDTTLPPYDHAQILITEVTPARQGIRPSAAAHNVVIGDAFTPMVAGVPVLRNAWRYLLTGAADRGMVS